MNNKIKLWIYFIATLSFFFAGMIYIVHFETSPLHTIGLTLIVSILISFFAYKISQLDKE